MGQISIQQICYPIIQTSNLIHVLDAGQRGCSQNHRSNQNVDSRGVSGSGLNDNIDHHHIIMSVILCRFTSNFDIYVVKVFSGEYKQLSNNGFFVSNSILKPSIDDQIEAVFVEFVNEKKIQYRKRTQDQ